MRPTGVRLAELLAVLSLAGDLGMGQPMEHALRQCLIALRLARRLNLDESDRVVVFYAALIAWVGCHVDAYEQAKWFGDDTAFKADFHTTHLHGPASEAWFVMRHVGTDRAPLQRARLGVTFLGDGRRAAWSMLENHWRAVTTLANELHLSQPARDSIEQTFERWDGRGAPNGLRGDDITLTARLVTLADVVEIFHRTHGTGVAIEVARERSGTQLDPQLVELFTSEADAVLEGLDEKSAWHDVVEAEPALSQPLTEAELDDALEAIADFADVKSPFTIGHSRAVADLAGAAAEVAGLGADAIVLLRRSGLVHDLGRLGVPNTVWDKAGPLTAAEVERVRLHPYLTERMLAYSPTLAPLGSVAVQHHERLDGSGYPSRLSGTAGTIEGRLLAAADMYEALLEPRPHRPAAAADQAATMLQGEARSGRLDPNAVRAVLSAAGHRVPRRTALPAGLTDREVDVLVLLTQGLSNRAIADRLFISRKTVDRHVEHIYTKTGTTNRALASLFAANHGLIRADGALPRSRLVASQDGSQ
jgi:HD-GYP domain-containing protein (c-di-GMP phosphodiesterase class II)